MKYQKGSHLKIQCKNANAQAKIIRIDKLILRFLNVKGLVKSRRLHNTNDVTKPTKKYINIF